MRSTTLGFILGGGGSPVFGKPPNLKATPQHRFHCDAEIPTRQGVHEP